jgi:hypothetical protein
VRAWRVGYRTFSARARSSPACDRRVTVGHRERQAVAIEVATAPAIGAATCQQLARRVAIRDTLEGWSLPVWQPAGRNCPDAGERNTRFELAPMLLMHSPVMRDSQRRFAGTNVDTTRRGRRWPDVAKVVAST